MRLALVRGLEHFAGLMMGAKKAAVGGGCGRREVEGKHDGVHLAGVVWLLAPDRVPPTEQSDSIDLRFVFLGRQVGRHVAIGVVGSQEGGHGQGIGQNSRHQLAGKPVAN